MNSLKFFLGFVACERSCKLSKAKFLEGVREGSSGLKVVGRHVCKIEREGANNYEK